MASCITIPYYILVCEWEVTKAEVDVSTAFLWFCRYVGVLDVFSYVLIWLYQFYLVLIDYDFEEHI